MWIKLITSRVFKVVLQELAGAAINIGLRTAKSRIYQNKSYNYPVDRHKPPKDDWYK